MRDKDGDIVGWNLIDQYVGYDQDFIPIADARSGDRAAVPYYKINFSWILKRQATDYYLRVVVPLLFILVVAYLSIFIPRDHFEAIVTIQVTALLSAVALYLSIPQVASEVATISDRIFLFNYMATSLMIVISILRVNSSLRKMKWFDRSLRAIHIFGIPLMCIFMAVYITQIYTGRDIAVETGLEERVPGRGKGAS